MSVLRLIILRHKTVMNCNLSIKCIIERASGEYRREHKSIYSLPSYFWTGTLFMEFLIQLVEQVTFRGETIVVVKWIVSLNLQQAFNLFDSCELLRYPHLLYEKFATTLFINIFNKTWYLMPVFWNRNQT